MSELNREQEILVPKVDESGSVVTERKEVEVEKLPNDKRTTEEVRKSRMRLIILFAVLSLAVFAGIIWEVVKIFSDFISKINA